MPEEASLLQFVDQQEQFVDQLTLICA